MPLSESPCFPEWLLSQRPSTIQKSNAWRFVTAFYPSAHGTPNTTKFNSQYSSLQSITTQNSSTVQEDHAKWQFMDRDSNHYGHASRDETQGHSHGPIEWWWKFSGGGKDRCQKVVGKGDCWVGHHFIWSSTDFQSLFFIIAVLNQYKVPLTIMKCTHHPPAPEVVPAPLIIALQWDFYTYNINHYLSALPMPLHSGTLLVLPQCPPFCPQSTYTVSPNVPHCLSPYAITTSPNLLTHPSQQVPFTLNLWSHSPEVADPPIKRTIHLIVISSQALQPPTSYDTQ